MSSQRPAADEYAPYHENYLRLVTEGDIVETLERQRVERRQLLRAVPAELETFRYAEGKWSIREVVGHLIDAERVFAYRALCIARGEQNPLPGFDEDSYMALSGYADRSLSELTTEIDELRRANISMFRGFSDEAWSRRGTANAVEVSARALAWILAGHEAHHLAILRERYLASLATPQNEHRVTGIGGVFFKARDAKSLRAWYQQHLGIKVEDYGGAVFSWREAEAPERSGETVWSIFTADTDYLEPGNASFMINYRVAELRPFLDKLRGAGVHVIEKVEESEFGKFGWVLDPEGNKIELWEPPPRS